MPTRPRPFAGRPLRRATALLVLLAGVASACGADAGVITLSAAPTPTVVTIPPVLRQETPPTDDSVAVDDPLAVPVADESPTVSLPPIVEPELRVTIPFADVVDVDDNKPPRDHDEFVAVAFTDIERWWGEVFPLVYGKPYEPLEGGVYAGYPERESPIPGCG